VIDYLTACMGEW